MLLSTVAPANGGPLAPELQARIRSATFEVVLRKATSDPLSYERALPIELIPYQERIDKFHSVGTAFAIGNDRYVSAAHVMLLGVGSQFGAPMLRDSAGKVFALARVHAYSAHEDYMVFSLAEPASATTIQAGETPGVGEPVFAVGNALGEGIVIRDGLLTSLTPEPQEGRWNWLRFSAAASPGNSGGPLLDAGGRAVGIVIAANAVENLNYALPMQQVLKAGEGTASFDMRLPFSIPIVWQPAVVSITDSFKLPLDWEEFSRRYLELDLEHYRANRQALMASDPPFPGGASAKGLAIASRPKSPSLMAQDEERRWISQGGHSKESAELTGEGSVKLREFRNIGLFELEPGKQVGQPVVGETSPLLNPLLKVLNVQRPVGTQMVRVTSAGPSVTQDTVKDGHGRLWRRGAWPLGFTDVHILTMSLNTPRGEVGMVRIVPSRLRAVGEDEMSFLADFFQTPMQGNASQWKAFLERTPEGALPDGSVKMIFSAGKPFAFQGPSLTASIDPQLIEVNDESRLTLETLLVGDAGRARLDVTGIRLREQDEDDGTGLVLLRQPRPAPDSGKDMTQRWSQMLSRTKDFDGVERPEQGTDRYWFRTSIPAPPADASNWDPKILYEMWYEVDGMPLPREMKSRRSLLEKSIQVTESPR